MKDAKQRKHFSTHMKGKALLQFFMRMKLTHNGQDTCFTSTVHELFTH